MQAIVIGAGASGMTAALLLAQEGHQVTLLEAAPHLAPLLEGFSREGVHFDTGFHYSGGLERNGALSIYLRLLGLEDYLPKPILLDKEQGELFRFYTDNSVASQEFYLPAGREALTQKAEEYFKGTTAEVCGFLNQVAINYAHSPFTDVRTSSDFSPEKLAIPRDETPLTNFLSKLIPLPLRAMLWSKCTLFGTLPSEAGISDFSLVASNLFDAVYSFPEGGKTLARAYKAALAKAEINCLVKTVATNIECGSIQCGPKKQHHVSGVKLSNGKNLPCDICIYTGNPEKLSSMLPPDTLRQSLKQHLENIVDTPKPFMVFGTSKRNFLDNRILTLFPEQKVETFVSGKEWPEGIIHITASKGREDLRGVVACCVANKKDTEIWSTGSKISIKHKQQRAKEFSEQIKMLCPELDDFNLLESATPKSMQNWIYGSSGSLYGASHSLNQLPLNPRTRITGLTLAGQSIILPGLLGSIVSGVVATGMLSGFSSIFKRLSQCIETE